MAQMKEQIKTPEKELNEMGTSNLLDTKFKTLVIKMLTELSENFNSIKNFMETIKKNQSEMKDTLIKIQNNLQGNNSRMDEAKDQINNLEYEKEKTTQSEHQEKQRIQKNEDSVRSFWDNFKHANVCIVKVPEEERDQEIRNLFEKKMTENFPNLVK